MGQKGLGHGWGIGDAKGLDQVLEVALMGVKSSHCPPLSYQNQVIGVTEIQFCEHGCYL